MKIHSQAVTYACNHSILEDNTGDSPAGNQLEFQTDLRYCLKRGRMGRRWGRKGTRRSGMGGMEENERNMTKILYFRE